MHGFNLDKAKSLSWSKGWNKKTTEQLMSHVMTCCPSVTLYWTSIYVYEQWEVGVLNIVGKGIYFLGLKTLFQWQHFTLNILQITN